MHIWLCLARSSNNWIAIKYQRSKCAFKQTQTVQCAVQYIWVAAGSEFTRSPRYESRQLASHLWATPTGNSYIRTSRSAIVLYWQHCSSQHADLIQVACYKTCELRLVRIRTYYVQRVLLRPTSTAGYRIGATLISSTTRKLGLEMLFTLL